MVRGEYKSRHNCGKDHCWGSVWQGRNSKQGGQDNEQKICNIFRSVNRARSMNEMNTKLTPTLYYPKIRGTLQPVRNLLRYLRVDFQQQDQYVSKSHEDKLTCCRPIFELDAILFEEPVAISRHLCRYYSSTHLLGLTPQVRAAVNQFLFCFSDVRTKLMKQVAYTARKIWADRDNSERLKLAAIKLIMDQECPIILSMLWRFINKRGWLMGELTTADFFFYELCFYLTNFFGQAIKNHAIYRNLKQYTKMFQGLEFFSVYDMRGIKIFLPFQEQINHKIIENAWEGDKDMIS